MNKPITLLYEDFKKELTNLINHSGLPAFIVETVLQNYLAETKIIVKKQYESDTKRYEEYLKTYAAENKRSDE